MRALTQDLLREDLLRELVAEARLAPSVHNIQPTRWRLLDDDRLALVDDTGVRAPVADPAGHDVRISHGAALEGMSLALNRRGLAICGMTTIEQPLSAQFSALCSFATRDEAAPDPLADRVAHRMSWRGKFVASPDDAAALAQLAADCGDVICIGDRQAMTAIAGWADQAEFSFVRGDDYRQELLEWMRLSPDHPHYLLDGLNRDALAMNALEATAARFVLGGLFKPLDRLGLAATLLADGAKTASAAGIVLFCRPVGEDSLLTGRHFYRAWLEIDRAGLSACPISALADHPDCNERLRKLGKIGSNLRLVNVFRVGRPASPQKPRHFRLPVDRLIV
jgi:nitroreductase